MRRTLHGIAFLIINSLHSDSYILSVRFHNFNCLTYREFISLSDLRITPFIHCLSKSQIRIFLLISIIIINLCILIRFSIEESGCKLSVGTVGNLFLVPWHICLIFLRALHIVVYCLAVSSGNCCDIESGFHTAFYLQTVDSAVNDIVHMLDHAEILGIKDIGSSFIFKYRHIFSRTFLLNNGIFPAAGMGTGSLVGITSCQIITEQTSSGIRNAHSAMDECFNLHILRNMLSDLFNLRKRKLSGCYHTLCSQIVPETICLIVSIVCLCTDMTFDFRAYFLCIHIDSRVCNDQCIRLQFFQFCQIFPHTRQIIIMGQNIYSHINFHSMFMGKSDSFLHIFMGKVLCFGTKSKGFSTDIYCICSENNSNLQHLKTASRNQQFYFSHIVHSCFTLTVTPSPRGMIEVIRDGLCFSSYRYSRILLYMVLFLRSTR